MEIKTLNKKHDAAAAAADAAIACPAAAETAANTGATVSPAAVAVAMFLVVVVVVLPSLLLPLPLLLLLLLRWHELALDHLGRRYMNSKSRSGRPCWSESRSSKETFAISEKPCSTSGGYKTKLHHWAGQTIRTVSLFSIKNTLITRSFFYFHVCYLTTTQYTPHITQDNAPPRTPKKK